MPISNERKRQLRAICLEYVGVLLREVTKTYSAFDDLPDAERKFVDRYIQDTGDNLFYRGCRLRRKG